MISPPAVAGISAVSTRGCGDQRSFHSRLRGKERLITLMKAMKMILLMKVMKNDSSDEGDENDYADEGDENDYVD